MEQPSFYFYRNPDELYHHGILGMKWGVRRYQPYGEGGYTPKSRKERKVAKYNKKIDSVQKDIDSFNPIKDGLKDKKGRQILTKDDVSNSINGLEQRKKKLEAKRDAVENGDDAAKKIARKKIIKRAIIGTTALAALVYAPEIIDSGAEYAKRMIQLTSNVAEDIGKAKGLNEVNGGFTLGLKQIKAGERFTQTLKNM